MVLRTDSMKLLCFILEVIRKTNAGLVYNLRDSRRKLVKVETNCIQKCLIYVSGMLNVS